MGLVSLRCLDFVPTCLLHVHAFTIHGRVKYDHNNTWPGAQKRRSLGRANQSIETGLVVIMERTGYIGLRQQSTRNIKRRISWLGRLLVSRGVPNSDDNLHRIMKRTFCSHWVRTNLF